MFFEFESREAMENGSCCLGLLRVHEMGVHPMASSGKGGQEHVLHHQRRAARLLVTLATVSFRHTVCQHPGMHHGLTMFLQDGTSG